MAKDPHRKPLQRVALQLGYVSIYWAWIEDVIDALITELAPLEKGHAANAITGSTDVRQKVQMLKALAFIRKGESEGWYEAVIANLNVIDGDIRSRRNAFVHSPWFVPKGKLVRHKKSTKIAKSQAFQPPLSHHTGNNPSENSRSEKTQGRHAEGAAECRPPARLRNGFRLAHIAKNIL